jgi:two-component system, LytTR family, sensor kinase
MYRLFKDKCPSLFKINAACILTTTLVIFIYESAYFYQKWQKVVLEKEHLEKIHLATQLEGLKNQVNPHFLFNSLNTLAYLIPEDQEKSVRFVEKLSKVYRYILDIKDAKLVTVQSEIDFIQSYIFLLKERFGENLIIEIDIPASFLSKELLPLALQILFENAIKHNVISALKPLTIKLYTQNEKIVVSNNIQPKQQVIDSTGFGLNNISNRYELIAGKKIEIIPKDENANFTVKLPLLDSKAQTKSTKIPTIGLITNIPSRRRHRRTERHQ